MKVVLNGEMVDYQSCVNLMDDEIREELHSDLAPCEDQEFLDAYWKKHLDKFDQDFTI